MRTIVGCILLCLIVSPVLNAQIVGNSQISGTVKDQSGAILPGSAIKATQTETQLVRTAVTDDMGSFVLRNLPVGTYDLEASLQGFSTFAQKGLVLQVNSSPLIPIVLKVGALTETVEVMASAIFVETRNTTVSQVIDTERVLELPLAGRNVTDLVLLAPSAVATGGFSSARNYPTQAISVSGGGGAQISYRLDGADHQNIENNLNLPLPFPDALQEFSMDTGASDARVGRSASGTVNSVTKSGTNTLRGSAFWYVRNYLFNARNPFLPKRDSLKRNQFGGTLGGPVIKNKMFWFVGYQFTAERSDPAGSEVVLPTPAMRAGDFTYILSSACQSKPITLKAPFVNNKLDPSQFNPFAVKLQAYVPIPTDPCGIYRYGFPNRPNDGMLVWKVDYQVSNKQSIFIRHLNVRRTDPIPKDDPNKNGLVATFTGQDNAANSIAIGNTYTFSSNLISSSRLSGSWTGNERLRPKNFITPKDLGLNLYVHNPGDGEMSVTNGFSWGGSGGGHFNQTVFSFTQDFEMLRGNHQFGFGGIIQIARVNMTNNQFSNGSVNFGITRTGYGYGDFYTGQPASITQARGQQDYERAKLFGTYLTYTWKASNRFTLNGGVRWEPYRPYQHQYGWLSHFELANFKANKQSKIYVNAPAGMMFPGDDGYPGKGMHKGNPWLFAPRLGMVFDPRGRGLEVIRVGYGLFYDYPIGSFNVRVTNALPYGGQVTLNFPSLPDPWANIPGGNPFPIKMGDKNLVFPQSGVYYTQPLDMRNTYVQQWNLSIQKRLGNFSLTANYLGTKTTNLWSERNANPVTFIPGNCVAGQYGLTADGACSQTATNNIKARRFLTLTNPTWGPYFENVVESVRGGDSNFNSGVLSIQKRGGSYSLTSNYTYGHCLSEQEASQFLSGQSYLLYADRRADYGNCGQDRRHNFNSSFIVSSPRLGGGVMRQITGGWQISAIYRVTVGSPMTLSTSGDNGRVFTTQRPDRLGSGKLDNPTAAKWFNTADFVQNALGTYGNSGRNILRGPRNFTFDMGLTRRFKLENKTLEFKMEAFNVFNMTRLSNPQTNITNTFYGQIRSANDPRIMQFAMKFTF
jgi:hypothetical protein